MVIYQNLEYVLYMLMIVVVNVYDLVHYPTAKRKSNNSSIQVEQYHQLRKMFIKVRLIVL